MLDIEAGGAKKLENYQNFAKAFRYGDYTAVITAGSRTSGWGNPSVSAGDEGAVPGCGCLM